MGDWQEIFNIGCRNLFEWGPGLLLSVIILFGLYKVLLRLGREVGLKIITALEKPAAALNQQAASMDKLTVSIKDYVGRDQNEHREIIILQKIILEKIEDLRRNGNGGDQKRAV